MLRACDGTLHYTVNGEDQGVAIEGVPPGVHAVIDLYGVCGQASVLHTTVPRSPPPPPSPPLLSHRTLLCLLSPKPSPRVLANTENSLASSQVMESSQVTSSPS